MLGASLAFSLFSIVLVPADKGARDFFQRAEESEAIYKELAAKLPKAKPEARPAKHELKRWHDEQWPFRYASRHAVRTKDGLPAQVLFIVAPSLGMPGEDFSMAFLLVNDQVVDCVSCRTWNRTATHELQLEDVNGDGLPDVAFRYSDGWWGPGDKRRHTRPGDKRAWLYSYTITSTGFKSIFPGGDRKLRIKHVYEPNSQAVMLRAETFPLPLREGRMVECTVTAKNTSKEAINLTSRSWVDVQAQDGVIDQVFLQRDRPRTIRPGETVVRKFILVLSAKGDEITLTWNFAPQRSALLRVIETIVEDVQRDPR
jgi:hypothetical protein